MEQVLAKQQAKKKVGKSMFRNPEHGFLPKLYSRCAAIEAALKEVNRGISVLQKNVILTSGSMIKSVTINTNVDGGAQINTIRTEYKKIIIMRDQMERIMQTFQSYANLLMHNYEQYTHGPKVQKTYLSNMNILMLKTNQINIEFEQLRQWFSRENFNPNSLAKKTQKALSKIEKHIAVLSKAVSFVRSILIKLNGFALHKHIPRAKVYWQALSDRSYKTFMKQRSPQGMFKAKAYDCSSPIMQQLSKFSPDTKKQFLKFMGLKQNKHLIFFQTKLIPLNADKPELKANGMHEYFFPKHIKVDIVKNA